MGFAGARQFVFFVVMLVTGTVSGIGWAEECQSKNVKPVELQRVGYQWELNNAVSNEPAENCDNTVRAQSPSAEDDQHIWLRGAGAIRVLPSESGNMF